MSLTTRLKLPYPELTDGPDGADVPYWMKALAVSLDTAALDDQGILANRPVSSAPSPGVKGRYYMVKGDSTPANNGILWRDNGLGWDMISHVGSGTIVDTRANRPAATDLPAGARYFATDQVAEWITDGTSWIRLGDHPGDIIFTAEATVRAGFILLEGQAWPSTTGIYADLYAKWGGATLPDHRGRTPVAVGTHTDVDTVNKNEGVAVGSRRPKHKSSIVRTVDVAISGGPYQKSTGGTVSMTSGGLGKNEGDSPAITAQPVFTVGPQTGSEPTDTPAYNVLQPQAKL
jgi:hypothetical protein